MSVTNTHTPHTITDKILQKITLNLHKNVHVSAPAARNTWFCIEYKIDIILINIPAWYLICLLTSFTAHDASSESSHGWSVSAMKVVFRVGWSISPSTVTFRPLNPCCLSARLMVQ